MSLPAFLEERYRDDQRQPTLLAVCAGFEGGTWRCEQFAQHLILDCLLDFILAHGEKDAINTVTAGRQLHEAAKIVFQTEKYQRRGEFGELLLHVIMRQFYGTLPAISKLYVKSGVNDTVKGFDAVHVTVEDEDLDLWLGEVKFYKDATSAINDVAAELLEHFEANYLRNEFLLIGNHLDTAWPHASTLSRLIAPQNSLDNVFKRVHVPVLVTYESPAISANGTLSRAFLDALNVELVDK